MWQKQEVRDSRSGITDIVRNSPSSFQEDCINLVHDNKEGNLEQRAGSEYWTTFDAPSTIRQIFQLEDYIFAYCYADPVTPGDDIDGRIYWVLEDGTSVSWTEVETEGTDTSFKIRLRDSKNKGLDITIPEADADFRDLVKTQATTTSLSAPQISLQTGFLRILVETADIAADGYYNTSYNYEDLKLAIEAVAAGYTVSYSPLTISTDEVHFSGSFDPDATDIVTGVGVTTGRWTSGFKEVFSKEGHLSINISQGSAYIELEPYDKSFTPNNSDPYAENPDSFPPSNDRQPLRKLYLQNHDNVITPVLQNAQSSKAYIAFDEETSTALDEGDDFKFARQEVRFTSGQVSSAAVATVSIWYERGCAPAPILNYPGILVRQVTGADRIDSYNTYTGDQPLWGQYIIYLDNNSAVTVSSMMTRLTNILDTKANNGDYVPNFAYRVTLDSGDSDNKVFTADTRNVALQDVNPTMYKNLPVEGSNHSYVYASYLRNEYDAQKSGDPNQFINDQEVSFASVHMLSPLSNRQVILNQSAIGFIYLTTYPSRPSPYIGRHKNYEYEESIHIPDTDKCIVTRTESSGTTFNQVRSFIDFTTDQAPDNIRYGDQDWDSNVSATFTFDDQLEDSDLSSREPAYFNGNVASHDSLPQQGSYYFTVVNQTGYHANSIGSKSRVYESPPGVPYAAPGLFFEDFEDSVTGISHFSNKPIIFTPNSTWRWEGTNGATGDGRTFIRLVSDEFGTIANQSIVRTNMGLFFFSKTGIVFTDGLKAIRVTEHLIERYSKWLSYIQTSSEEIGPRYLRGTYDEIRRRVLWSSLDEDSNPIIIVLDVFEGISDKMPVFIEKGNTNVSYNGSEYVTTNMYQTSGLFFSEDNNSVYRAQDQRILKVSQDSTSDQYWTGTTTLNIPIRPFFKSVAFDYGIRSNRKWTMNIMWGFEDQGKTGVSLQPLGWNDLSVDSHDLFPMVNYQHIQWSSDFAQTPQVSLEQFFGHTDVSFKTEFIVAYKRKFPRGKIRNTYKQVGFEHLPITLGTLSKSERNVSAIDVRYVSGTGKNLVEIDVTVTDTGDNSVVDLGLDGSGSFYVKWDNQESYVKVHSFVLSASTYTLQVYTSDESTNTFTYTNAWPITVGRVFSDQKILLSDYTMTFRDMGDRTKGVVKSEAEGGFNG